MPTMSEELLDGMEKTGEILPGSREKILGMEPHFRNLPADAAAERLHRWLNGECAGDGSAISTSHPLAPKNSVPIGARFRNPAYRPDESKTQLERVCARFNVRDPAKLAGDLQLDCGHMGEPEQAREIARRLDRRDFAEQHRPWVIVGSESEQRIERLLSEHFGNELAAGAAGRAAKEWCRDLSGASDDEIVRQAARRLAASPHGARFLRPDRTIAPNDPRRRHHSGPVQGRQDDQRKSLCI